MSTLFIFGLYITLTGTGILLWELVRPNSKLPHKQLEEIFKRCNIAVKEGEQVYYPVLITKEKKESGWFLLYSLPAGLSHKKITDHPDLFQRLGEAEIEAERGFVSFAISEGVLKEKVAAADRLELHG